MGQNSRLRRSRYQNRPLRIPRGVRRLNTTQPDGVQVFVQDPAFAKSQPLAGLWSRFVQSERLDIITIDGMESLAVSKCAGTRRSFVGNGGGILITTTSQQSFAEAIRQVATRKAREVGPR